MGDFGVPIAIILMAFLGYMVPQTYTEKLIVPAGLTPSSRDSWIVDPSGTEFDPLGVWVPWAAGIPAMLVYILLFMETHIAE